MLFNGQLLEAIKALEPKPERLTKWQAFQTLCIELEKTYCSLCNEFTIEHHRLLKNPKDPKHKKHWKKKGYTNPVAYEKEPDYQQKY